MKNWRICDHNGSYTRFGAMGLKCDQCHTIIPRGHPSYEKEERFKESIREHNRNARKIRESRDIPDDFVI